MNKLDSLDFRDKLVVAEYLEYASSGFSSSANISGAVIKALLNTTARELREKAAVEEKEFEKNAAAGIFTVKAVSNQTICIGGTLNAIGVVPARGFFAGESAAIDIPEQCPSCGHKLHDEFCAEDVGLYRRMQVTEDEWDIERDGAQCGCPVIGVAVSQ